MCIRDRFCYQIWFFPHIYHLPFFSFKIQCLVYKLTAISSVSRKHPQIMYFPLILLRHPLGKIRRNDIHFCLLLGEISPKTPDIRYSLRKYADFHTETGFPLLLLRHLSVRFCTFHE